MIGQLRAELLKQRSTQTVLALLAGMFGLVGLAIALHVLTPAASELATRSDQLPAFEVGTRVGMLFAALVGALAITAEFRYGTIRPTFLVTPRRTPVITAKLTASGLTGLVFGLVATGLMAGAVTVAFAARGIDNHLTSSDYLRLLAGGMAAAALWATIGVGVGALFRNQVSTLVGICAWLLLVEHLIPSDVARYTPGNAGLALAIQATHTQLAPSVSTLAVGALALPLYAAAASVIGWRTSLHRDAV
ncbi:MAG TPA: ABC transporter permease [Acidimicrobiia bacterium]|jgi:ABC-type transport system involved in multi-copper enzyme maturation permease subunit